MGDDPYYRNPSFATSDDYIWLPITLFSVGFLINVPAIMYIKFLRKPNFKSTQTNLKFAHMIMFWIQVLSGLAYFIAQPIAYGSFSVLWAEWVWCLVGAFVEVYFVWQASLL